MIDFIIICSIYLYYWVKTFYLWLKSFVAGKYCYFVENYKFGKYLVQLNSFFNGCKLSNRKKKKLFFLQQKKQEKWFFFLKVIFIIGVIFLLIFLIIAIYINSLPPADSDINGLLAQKAKLERAGHIYLRRLGDARERLLYIPGYLQYLFVSWLKVTQMNHQRCNYFYPNEYVYYKDVLIKVSVLPDSVVEFLKEEQLKAVAFKKEELANLMNGRKDGLSSLANIKDLHFNRVKKTTQQVFLDANLLIPSNLQNEVPFRSTSPPPPLTADAFLPPENFSFSKPQEKMTYNDEINFIISDNYSLQEKLEFKNDVKINYKNMVKPEMLLIVNNMEGIKKGLNPEVVENMIKSLGFIPDMPLFGKVLKYICQSSYADYINFYNKYNSNDIQFNQTLDNLDQVDTKIFKIYIYYKLAFICLFFGMSLTSLSIILTCYTFMSPIYAYLS